MTPQMLKSKLETLAPETKATITDLTGTEDHYEALIVCPLFQGKTLMEQHRMVLDLMQASIDSGDVHALSLKTYSPEQYSKVRKF